MPGGGGMTGGAGKLGRTTPRCGNIPGASTCDGGMVGGGMLGGSCRGAWAGGAREYAGGVCGGGCDGA